MDIFFIVCETEIEIEITDSKFRNSKCEKGLDSDDILYSRIFEAWLEIWNKILEILNGRETQLEIRN